MPPLVEIGLTDLPKSGCAMAHPAHPGTTGLLYRELHIKRIKWQKNIKGKSNSITLPPCLSLLMKMVIIILQVQMDYFTLLNILKHLVRTVRWSAWLRELFPFPLYSWRPKSLVGLTVVCMLCLHK